MLKLLLVDDEPAVLETIFELLTERLAGTVEVTKTDSGRQALALLETVRYDLLVTDIKMPGIDGLQLADLTRRQWPDCRIVFLTGHDSFAYAYEALRKDYDSYLLKAENDEVIVSTVLEVLERARVETADRELLSKSRAQWDKFLPQLRQDFFRDTLEGRGPTAAEAGGLLESLGTGMDVRAPFQLVEGRLDAGGSSPVERLSMLGAARLLFEERFLAHTRRAWIRLDSLRFAVLVQDEQRLGVHPAVLTGALERVQQVFVSSTGETLSLVSGEPVLWDQLSGEHALRSNQLGWGAGLGREALVTTGRSGETPVTGDPRPSFPRALGDVRNSAAWVALLDGGRNEEFLARLDGVLKVLGTEGEGRPAEAQEIFLTLSGLLLSFLNRWEGRDAVAGALDLHPLGRPESFDGWQAAADFLRDIAERLVENRRQRSVSIPQASVEHVRAYIQAHLADDLSLDRLASLVYFNPSYFSRLFRRVTGLTLTDYLTSVRVEEAKRLLVESGHQVQTIASLVGLGSATYLGRLFKKATGLTPQEHRERNFKK